MGAGRWILENRQVPRLDPFTFTSADRPWIDLHWLFQVLVATAFGLGGARGTIVMAAGLGTTAILAAGNATPRERRGPAWLTADCWLQAVVLLSARFAPRPELSSMLGRRVGSRPAVGSAGPGPPARTPTRARAPARVLETKDNGHPSTRHLHDGRCSRSPHL